jgi:hypothetical protein
VVGDLARTGRLVTYARRDLAILGRLRILRSLRIMQIIARMIEVDGDVCQVRWHDQAR